jgi:RNA-directed DNA polymerase
MLNLARLVMGFFEQMFRRTYKQAEPAPVEPPPTATPSAGKKSTRKKAKKPKAETPAPTPPSAEASAQPAAPEPLSADHFLPIEREELVSAAQKINLWGSWFGRRDLIPPATDQRTGLVDRGLVTQGLLTPEELVEIHRVGDEMLRLRPQLDAIEHKAKLGGEAAVKAERDRKAKLKAQKKAEAAERKRKRAEEVAHRRATDILYLGRGVSGRLNDRQSDAAKLKAAGLSVLSSPADVARAMGITVPQLRWLAFHTEVASRVHYVSFTVPKKSGGVRVLHAPHRKLAAAQRWVFENIVGKLSAEEPAHGFLPGRSTLTNALPHAGKTVVLNMDLEGFFPSITFPRVRSVFHRLGYSPAVATVLALLCTECPRKQVTYEGEPYFVATGPRGLPQGACTSPGLSNQVARRLDKRLRGLAQKMGLTYTRYADDLTFSGNEEVNDRVGYLMARVRHIARDEGFVVNEKKTRVLRQSTAQVVTGLVVNDRPGVPRHEVRRIRAILHRARTEGLAAQNREGRPNFLAWLQGMIAYVSMVRPDIGGKFRAELDALVSSGL